LAGENLLFESAFPTRAARPNPSEIQYGGGGGAGCLDQFVPDFFTKGRTSLSQV
jgi:hypothetical protein